MGLQMLPDELLLLLADKWPCRGLQARQLSALLSPALSSPPTLVVHGSEATGKTGLLRSYLEAVKINSAFLSCAECITGRHLLERTLAACTDAIHSANGSSHDPPHSRCESLSTLASSLERLLANTDKFVLVLDGIDEQREAPPTLLPAMARLGTIIPCLTVVLVVAHPHPRLLHSPGIPHLYFPPYTREQAIQILSLQPLNIFSAPSSPAADDPGELSAEDNAWVWTRFLAAVWDSLASGAARDILSFQAIATKLWRPFVAPIVDGTFGTRDFSRLMVSQRKLFQADDILLDRVVGDSPDTLAPSSQNKLSTTQHDLPYYSKWLLCAAYLASFNPVRSDSIHFAKAAERRRRKKGGGTMARRESNKGARKIPRHLLAPSPFPIDRLFAILHAVLPHDLTPTIDLYTQLATLCSLRLLVRTAVVGGDVLESGGKWKVAFGWDYARRLAQGLDFDITDYVAE
ncbi:hypothetical protein MBLNU459_g1728t1 [Dothideomycetes sp. NU459]